MPETCFHCGLPVTDARPPARQVLGERRQFCCTGCAAVCRAILDAGHEDYYRYREQPAPSADTSVIPSFLEQAELYDNPAIQRGFVKTQGEACEASLILEEIRCAACLWLNERHLRSLDGVQDVGMDYTSQRAWVRWDPQRIKFSDILKAIAEIGYTAHPYDPAHRDALVADQKRRSIERIIFAGAIGMMVMNFSIASYIFGDIDANGQYPLWIIIGRWTSLIATISILAYPGQEFFAAAWRDLKRGRLGMDVPIVIGLLTAWAGSFISTITQRGEVYFDSIAMFVFLLLLARFYELKGRLIAARSLDRMAMVIPAMARRLGDSGEEEVPVIELIPGDRVRVRPGDKVPVDGILSEGTSRFDESLLTGESTPVNRAVGDRVMAGSLNGDQPVVIRVSHSAEESTVGVISRLVERSLKSRPYYAQLAERAALWFVAIILIIAAVTALIWSWLDPSVVVQNVVAVLIVTCPCALALATPVAISLGAGRFADLGFLPMRMNALEPLATSDLIVFDKTGTLTQGHPQLEVVEALGELAEFKLKGIAASLEQACEHPFAKAFRATHGVQAQAVKDLRIHPSAGVEGTLNNRHWRLGKPEFAISSAALEKQVWQRIQGLRGRGYSVIMLADEQGPQALFGLLDAPRPGLEIMLKGLRRYGVNRFVILSGDHQDNVAKLAARLGIEEFHGGFSPTKKLDWIKRVQRGGRRVIMVGDGINDAPTLAAADVSLSFSEAANVAQVSSDFVILGATLHRLAEARQLARKTRRIILQNLSWAAAYNLSAVPLAALGFIPPWGAAIGMSLSSLVVVGNALRLK